MVDAYIFQFLMVRLKHDYWKWIGELLTEFQFLMVRLKLR